MGRIILHRHVHADPAWVGLFEPSEPSKRILKRLGKLGFEQDPNDGIWYQTLEALGRKNMSCQAIAAMIRQVGLDAEVVDAPTGSDADQDEDGWSAEGLLDFRVGTLEEALDRSESRIYDLTRRVEALETQNATLLGMLRRLTGDPGAAGRRIAGEPPAPTPLEGRSVYFDRARGVPVAATPEESVRQIVLAHLEDALGVPRHLLHSEYRIPRHQDRADIVLGEMADGARSKALAVIECKAPTVPLDDDVWAQAERYGRKLGARFVAITDGESLRARRRGQREGEWTAIQGFPTFQMMLDGISPALLVPRRRPIPRPAFEALLDESTLRRYADARAVVPEPVDGDWAHLITLINLSSLLLDDAPSTTGANADGWTCAEDRGLIDTSFGNAGYSSHAYSGLYRCLLLRHEEQGDALTFYRTWTQSSGHTMLSLGLHHADGRRHHAVQLNLGRALDFDEEDDQVALVHDGRMSKGGGGSFSRADVLARVEQEAPDLVDGRHAQLGWLPTDRLITWDDAFPVLVRLLRFARAADGLRTG